MNAECYVSADGAPSALILSPSTVKVGGWRLTFWDDRGPSGHDEYPCEQTARKALRDTVGPWPAIPDFCDATPASYRRAAAEPDWFGLETFDLARASWQ